MTDYHSLINSPNPIKSLQSPLIIISKHHVPKLYLLNKPHIQKGIIHITNTYLSPSNLMIICLILKIHINSAKKNSLHPMNPNISVSFFNQQKNKNKNTSPPIPSCSPPNLSHVPIKLNLLSSNNSDKLKIQSHNINISSSQTLQKLQIFIK